MMERRIARLGPCELQDPSRVNMSAITGGKKRKKDTIKPQSQINKCLNEKRRRTQENLYIDDLAELVSGSDMSSGKTDKCQILQKTVDQIKRIREEGSNSHAVQQGEVSSSNSNLLSTYQLGSIFVEASDGFMFVVNTEGRVESVSENITKYINYTKDDVIGKDIYNIIHHGDHSTFMPNLLPMSLGWTTEPPQNRSRIFNCRFLVKPPDDKDETIEEKQQRISQYESMEIYSVLMSNKSADRLESGDVSSVSELGPNVVCIAHRISPSEKPTGNSVEQFCIKLDTTGTIIDVNSSKTSYYSKYINKDFLLKKLYKDLCHPHDLSTLTKHLSDTLQVGQHTSDVYRMYFSPDTFLKIQTRSRFFQLDSKKKGMNVDEEEGFIMTTSSIIADNDLMSIEGGQLSNNKVCSGHSSNRCANNSNNNNGNNNNNVGGPLMSVAHLNGQVSGISARSMAAAAVSHAATSSNSIAFSAESAGGDGSDALTSLNTSTGNPFNHLSGNMDLEFELFPSSTWGFDNSAGWSDRPESRTSGPTSSRPSSQPAPTSPSPQGTFSNSAVASHCSPLRPFSPTTVSAAHTFSNSFPFSPLQESTQTSTLSSNAASGVSTNGGASSGVGVGSNIATTTGKRIEESNKSGCPTGNNGGGSTMDSATTRTSNVAITAVETQNNSVVSTESGRLRNLLTKGPSANEDSQDNTNNDSDNQKHRILKILLNQQDEDDYHSEHKMRTSPSNMPKPSMEHSKLSLGNNMLLQLLNEKNDDEDEETRAGAKKRNELLQQLMKDQDEERKLQEQQNREDDSLLRSLGFRNTTPSPSQSGDHIGLGGTAQIGQKRPGEDGDLNIAVKRPVDGSHQVSSSGTNSSNNPSKLWEKNKMLASLLAKQPPQPTNIPPIPASVISATPQDKLPRLKQQQQQQQQHQQQQQQQQSQPQTQQQHQQQQQPWTGGNVQVASNVVTTTATSTRPLQSQSRQLPRQATNTYLSQILSQQQRSQMSTIESEFTSSGDYRQANTDQTTWDNQSSDPVLSDILDQVIEFVPDDVGSSAIAKIIDAEASQNPSMKKETAINAIQKVLMRECESDVNSTSSTITIPGTPPAYSTALGTTSVTTSHSYQPPPMYQQPAMRFNTQPGVRQSSQFPQQLQLQQQQRSKIMQQQQQQQQQQLKQRLLQQQKQQQLVIPSNATAPDQISSGIHNIDNLLSNTVAPPNVSLQRSSVSDSQVSPGYGGSVQMATGHRLAHSYSHPSTMPQHSVVNNNFNSGQQVSAAARLSPHSPANILPFSHPQSPRVTQGNYGNTPRLFNVNQVRPQQQVTAQQQLQQQQQRSMPSPGTPVSARQSPFPTEVFPPPTSPTANQFPSNPNTGAPNAAAQYRLQRTTSTPSATTQLPGAIGSPRNYSGVGKDPLLSPSHTHSACPATPTHHNTTTMNNTQHFSSQHTPMLYQHNTNTMNTADMQNSQFCYERSSVSLYSSGGEAQDARSLPPGNPVNHQMGNASTSEFVRQELRAIVGARTQQQQQQQRVPNNLQNNLSGQVPQDDLEAFGLTFEMSSAGEAVVSDGPAKSWAIGSAGSAPSSSRTTMEEVARGDPKSSLLQKLLSE